MRISYKNICDWILFDLQQQANAIEAHAQDLAHRADNATGERRKQLKQSAIILTAESDAIITARARILRKIREEQNK